MAINDKDFYSSIIPFNDFNGLLNDSNFILVPDSWSVVITDVRGSTKAIQEGRYNQVNLIGAATITCVINCLNNYEIPFVFGGDGSTLLIHKDDILSVKNALAGLKTLSLKEFNLELRVGIVPLSILKKYGATLLVGKYELSSGNCTAQFKGTALSLAEEMIKKREARRRNFC